MLEVVQHKVLSGTLSKSVRRMGTTSFGGLPFPRQIALVKGVINGREEERQAEAYLPEVALGIQAIPDTALGWRVLRCRQKKVGGICEKGSEGSPDSA